MIVMSTRTWVPSGVTLSIEPTGTPSTSTWLSSNSAEALLKYAVTCLPPPWPVSTQMPAAMSTASTPTSPTNCI